MNLKIKDVVELLQVSEKTVYRWIQDKKIPAYRINHQYRFNKQEINDWIIRNKITVSEKIFSFSSSKRPIRLITLLQKGGIFYKIKGVSVQEILKNTVSLMPVPPEINRETIIASLLAREEMMPTAIGQGIAIPHPRNPLIANHENESLSIFFPADAIDYHAIDGEKVHTIFITLSSRPQRHLEVLSKLSHLCQQNEFILLLKNQAGQEEIFRYIEHKETSWLKTDGTGKAME